MAKKRAKKKTKKATKAKKAKKKKKVVRKKKKTVKKKIKRKSKARVRLKASGEKIIAKVDHFFGKISVAAFKLKAPLSVGDTIHIKGHTTDFRQRIDSIQIEHQTVTKAKKGDEIGIKVSGKVRVDDVIYLVAKGQSLVPQPVVKPIFPTALSRQPQPQPKQAEPKNPSQAPPYGGTKFLKF